jgi:ppGpp synthetase/RelA/SpoT-type nucleotidyltranferase
MNELEAAYRHRFDAVLNRVASGIELQLREYFAGVPRLDRINARAKSVERFMGKALTVEKGMRKYSEPLRQIQDQIGARIITFYISDVGRIAEIVEKYYRPIESKIIVPDSEWEFGYFGRHYILVVPSDVIDPLMDKAAIPEFFELQIKTLFQHAWPEANHDLGYKPGSVPLTSDAVRRLAFTSAQSWGADRMFEELFRQREATACRKA